MPSTNDLLSLRGVTQQFISYRFTLLDNEEREIGELHPHAFSTTPQIAFNATRTIQRDMSSFNLIPSELSEVNTLRDRVRPSMVLANGAEEPLGVFIFADASRPQYSYGESLSGSLVDKGFILDQPTEHAVSIAEGEYVRNAVITLLSQVNLVSIVDISTARTGGPMSWPPGTSRLRILNDLAVTGAYMPPWFDRYGICNVRTLIDPATADITVSYRDGDNIYASSAVETNDLLTTPNRTVIVSTDANSAAVVGVYDAPASAPYSSFNRGFVIAEVIQQQGVASSAEAVIAARTYAQSRGIFEHMTFYGPPDFRHDGFSVIDYNGERWLEQGWTLPLSPSGPMTHTVKRVYSDE